MITKPMLIKYLSLCLLFIICSGKAVAFESINAFGIDLLKKEGKPNANILFSPYSIQSALAMTYAGAEGVTRSEMAKVLHYPPNETQVDVEFAMLRRSLDDFVKAYAQVAEKEKKQGLTSDPITLTVANRLFGQTGYEFRDTFLTLVKDNYAAPLELLDFAGNAAGATEHINGWVEEQTQRRISNLIPPGGLDSLTKLVLVNAVYMKAPWKEEFKMSSTVPRPFHKAGRAPIEVPTMSGKLSAGYSTRDGFTMVSIPYRGGDLQLLILLPDKTNGLTKLERKLTPGLLAEGASLPERQVILYLPKFKLEPPMMTLSEVLKSMGMKSAFNSGSADFERMSPKPMNISQVIHKTFLSLDEKGTEAAAATAVVMATKSAGIHRTYEEVHIDRPFIFAIQHRPSGTCLFLGHVTDPVQ